MRFRKTVFRCLLGTLLLVVSCSPGERNYRGRSLASCLTDFDSHIADIRKGAAEAVREMGTNNLPVLIARIRRQESRLKSELRNLTEDDSPVTVSPDCTAKLCYQALAACDALGPMAEPALPALEELLFRLPGDATFDYLRAEMGTQLDAAYVMVRVSPERGLPVLKKALTNEVPAVRQCARICLELVQSRSPLLYPTNGSDTDFWDRSRHFRTLLIKAGTNAP